MSQVTDHRVASWRLRAQHLTTPLAPTAVGAVRDLLCVQSENHAQASWAVAARTQGLTEPGFGRLFDDGAILRTHVLRPTWHYVCPEDIGWLLELTGARVWPTFGKIQRELGIDDAALARSAEAIVEALSKDGHLTREQLGQRLDENGLPAQGRALMVVMAHAELSGRVCSGVLAGNRHTYALLEERAPSARHLDRDHALAELVLRYFTGHGPATERDLAYWATLTLTDVRTGLKDSADQLVSFEHHGRTYWQGQHSLDQEPSTPRGHLLQILDEYYRGYQETRYVLDAQGLMPKGRETSAGMAIIDGQIVGGMR